MMRYHNGDRADFLDKKMMAYLEKFKKRIKSAEMLDTFLQIVIEAEDAENYAEYMLEHEAEMSPIIEKYRNKTAKARYLDFNQGVDGRKINDDNMTQLARLAIRPLRIAFDIADQVYAACKNDGDLLSVKRLKAALKEADSAIENLWVALEKGQSVDMITERIHKREAEKKELEKQLAIEIKKQSGMEYSVILSFLDYLRMLPNDNEYKRRALVNIFINAIYLYDGYFTMILNAGNRPLSIENIPLDDIEKTFENDDVGCSSNSQLVADAPPK